MKERIQKIMDNERMPPAKFAQVIGTAPAIISHILNGRNNPSLEVVQKILTAFPSINPDWLLFGSGSIDRETAQSRQTSLFDIKPDTPSKSDNYIEKSEDKRSTQPTLKEDVSLPQPEIRIEYREKTVKKITAYYSDMTFEEFSPNEQK